MARVETIVVGGGINPSSPFTIGAIPKILNTDPPTVDNSILRQTTPPAGGAIVVGTSDVAGAAPTETFRTIGGIVSECVITGVGAGSNADSVRLGRGNTITGVGASLTFTGGNILIGGLALIVASGGGLPNVVIGYNAQQKTSGTGNAHGCVIIGANATVNAPSHSGMVLIGVNTSATGNAAIVIGPSATSAAAAIVIGNSADATISSATGVCIGASAQLASGTGVVIGDGSTIGTTSTSCTVVGDSSSTGNNAARTIIIGSGNTSPAAVDVIMIGNSLVSTGIPTRTVIIGNQGNNNYSTFVFGGPWQTSTVALLGDVTFKLANAITTNNLTAGNLIIQAGGATGNATPPTISFQTGTVGASGNTLQTQATRLTIATAAITATVPVIHPAGAVGAPAIRFTDADTGLFEQAAGNVAVAAQGKEVARFTDTAVATETALMIYDVDNNTLERVTVGAADSGGVGFKLLRIPN